MNENILGKLEQGNVIKLMFQVLDLSLEVELEIKLVIEKIGIKSFFLEIDSLNFSDEVKEKVKALENIIKSVDDNIQANAPEKAGDIDDK